ncbi:MAG: DUF1727 domain-containing protein [Clostridia bacterium]|nr:DUF1727 domain-containing protein [Clostridia bacterium]
MRGFITILLTKIIIFLLKISKKNGGNLPGKYAYKWYPNIFKYFKIDCPVIAVVGTNGKTMTNNAINKVLTQTGSKVLSNLEGNNMETGILSMLIKNCSLTGKIKSDYLTLEVDESYLSVTFKDLRLDTLVILDFFRDQLDRVGEVESLILKINDFLKTYNGNLVLNNDDPNVARLGKANPENKNVYYFSVDKYKFASKEMKEAGEGKFCPFCSTRLEYEYYQYAHIGKFKCPNCNYGDNPIFKKITDVNLEDRTFKVEDKIFKTQFNSIYSVYNFAATITAASLYNIDSKYMQQAIENFVLNNGRQEKLIINGCETTINLAKNPTGANVSLRLVNEDDNSKDVLFVLNDNVADGKDVSWIYDIDFSDLNNVDRIITSGTRAYDMAICIKNNGVPKEKIEAYLNLNDAVKALYKTNNKKYAISNYTAVQDTRHAIMNFEDRRKNERT